MWESERVNERERERMSGEMREWGNNKRWRDGYKDIEKRG